jgi:hypothetical protein
VVGVGRPESASPDGRGVGEGVAAAVDDEDGEPVGRAPDAVGEGNGGVEAQPATVSTPTSSAVARRGAEPLTQRSLGGRRCGQKRLLIPI